MRPKVILKILILLTIFIGFSTIAKAETLEELNSKKEQLTQQITQANEEKSNIQIELTETLEQLNNLDSRILEYETKIKELTESLTQVQTQIADTEEKLENIEKNYKLQEEALAKRMVSLYETGEIKYLDFLLSSNSLSEFISNYYLIGEIAKYDTQLLENIERQKAEMQIIKEILKLKEGNIKSLKTSKETTAIALENSRIIKNSYANKLTEEEKATQAKIDEFQKELNSIESEIYLLTTGNLGESYVGGEFAWPAPGYTTITSQFGMRLHPIFKVNRMHTGTDIGMPTGASIVAANDGIVIKSTYTTGYGNMVMIDHGGGVCTVYGHGSENVAQAGQVVKRGEIVMKAGSTGWSTGPHLHFEIRINGNYVDPLPYITRKANIEEKQEDAQPNQEDGGKNE